MTSKQWCYDNGLPYYGMSQQSYADMLRKNNVIYLHEEPGGYCPGACTVHKECAQKRVAVKRANQRKTMEKPTPEEIAEWKRQVAVGKTCLGLKVWVARQRDPDAYDQQTERDRYYSQFTET